MKKIEELKILFFDLGGTLISLDSLVNSMFKVVRNSIIEKDHDFVYKWAHLTYQILDETRNNRFLTFKEIHKKGLEETLKIYDIDLEKGVISQIIKETWNDFILNYRLFEDVKPVLEKLRRNNYRLGVISDSDIDVANGILRQPQLKDFFDIIVVSEQFRTYKPDSLLFEKAIDLAECKSENAVYVGDSERDIKGAKEIGIFSVIINRGELFHESEPDVQPDLEIKNLKEIPWIT